MTIKNYTPIHFAPPPHKEAEPMMLGPENYQINEEGKHEIEKEVGPYIQIKPQSIELPPDLKKIGAQPAPPPLSPDKKYQNIKLPIPDDRVVVGLRAPINSSFRWLATLAVYILKRAHLGLKVVHGKVIRVFAG